MFDVILGLIAGMVLILLVPALLPARYNNVATANAVRGLGVLVILFSVGMTSFVSVPDGHLGQLFRIYGGGSLREGKIVAANGENGPQAEILTPGFHVWPFVNILYSVDTSHEEVFIPSGKVGVLVARDGASLRPGQAFADPFPAELGYRMLDAVTFLKSNGQRGQQLTVLTPGKYRLNSYLWDVAQRDAKEVPAGFVGVVKSNVHADIDFGTLSAKRPQSCDVILNRDNDRADNMNVARLEAPIVPVGCTGVWDKSLQPGKYFFNPDAFAITEIDTRAQVWTYAGGYKRANISLTVDTKGDIVQSRTEVDVPVAKDNADSAVFVKMEGWDVPLELRVVAQVSPAEASCVVAGVGTLKEVEDRVLTPSIRAITRDVAGGSFEVTEIKVDETGKPVLGADGKPIIVTVKRPTKVLDLINQRPLIEGEIEHRIRPEGQKSCVTIREVRLGEPAIPPELLVAVRREQLATQLAKAFIQEKGAQEKRIESDKAKATADQQGDLVRAEIGVQTSLQNAQALRNQGLGERDKLTLISEGQEAQTKILGADATVRLRQYELFIDRIFSFADKHPEVLTAALANAQKFVPERVTNLGGGQGGESLVGAAAILGDFLSQSSPRPAPPAAAPPAPAPAPPRAAPPNAAQR
ncbi:MAG: SPFH domain-containing protein [Xanthobacteraceae bacterium]